MRMNQILLEEYPDLITLLTTWYSGYWGHIELVYGISDKSQQRNHSAEPLEIKQGMTLAQETQASDGQLER